MHPTAGVHSETATWVSGPHKGQPQNTEGRATAGVTCQCCSCTRATGASHGDPRGPPLLWLGMQMPAQSDTELPHGELPHKHYLLSSSRRYLLIPTLFLWKRIRVINHLIDWLSRYPKHDLKNKMKFAIYHLCWDILIKES